MACLQLNAIQEREFGAILGLGQVDTCNQKAIQLYSQP